MNIYYDLIHAKNKSNSNNYKKAVELILNISIYNVKKLFSNTNNYNFFFELEYKFIEQSIIIYIKKISLI